MCQFVKKLGRLHKINNVQRVELIFWQWHCKQISFLSNKHVVPPNAAKVLDNVLFVFKRHGVLLKSLAVSSLKLLIHLCIILGPGIGIIHASLHLAQIAHEVPLAITRHGFLLRFGVSVGSKFGRHNNQKKTPALREKGMSLDMPFNQPNWPSSRVLEAKVKCW